MAERENSPPTEDAAPEEQAGRSDGPATKAAAKKTPARKRPAAQKPAQKPAQKTARKAAPPKRPSGMRVAALACRQLADLTGRELEGVVGLERTEGGWIVEVEVLELRRVPNTTDVLAVYEVALDSDGDLDSYRRLHRYERGKVREEP